MSRINTEEFLEYLYGRLPTQWRLLDQEQGLPLYNYLKVIVYGGMDKNIELANKFTELTDPVRCPSPFFPTLYESIGLKYDWGINEIYHRRVFQNIGELMRRRGSYNSIRYLIRVLTGMECNLDYQRSPVKSYENTDLVAFQGYNKGDITVLEMKGETTQENTEGYNVYNTVAFSPKVITGGDCRVKVYDNGVIEVTGSKLSSDDSLGNLGYIYTDFEKKRLKPGIYTILGHNNLYPFAYFKLSYNTLNMEINKNKPTIDITQRMLDNENYYAAAGVWGSAGSTVIPGLMRPYVVCDSDNPNLFDAFALNLGDGATYTRQNNYDFTVIGNSNSNPQASFDIVPASRFSEYAGKTLYISGEIAKADNDKVQVSRNHYDGTTWTGSVDIKQGVGKFRNVPYVVPMTAEGSYTRIVFRPKNGTMVLKNIRVTEKPYVDDNKVSNGLNLLNNNNFSITQTKNGITCTNNGDGSVTLNGTANPDPVENTYFYFDSGTKELRDSIQGKTLTFTGGISSKTYLQVWGYKGDNASVRDNGEGVTFTFNNLDKGFNFVVGVPAGATLKNVTIRPMLVAGSTAKPWEPFTYGIPVKGHVTPTEKYEPYSMVAPSPSIEHRQPFKSVGDPVNLITLRLQSKTSLGVTYTNNGDNTISLKGTNTEANANASFRIDQTDGNQSDIKTYEPGYYSMYFEVLEGEDTTEQIGLALYSPSKNKTYVSEATSPLYVSETVTDGVIVVLVKGGKTVNSRLKVQLEKGCFNTDWKPSTTGGVYEFITSKGRRNLLSDTNMGYYGFLKTAYSKLERAQTPNDKNAVKAICAKTGNKYGAEKRIEAFKASTIKPNTTYQVSFDYYINSTQVPTFWVQIADPNWRKIVEFNAKSVEVQKWNSIEFNAKSVDFLQVNTLLKLFVCVDGPNTVEGDYIIIQNLQLHETDLPNEWVPALEDQTAGIPNNDDVQLFDAGSMTDSRGGSHVVSSNVITVTGKDAYAMSFARIDEKLVEGKDINLSVGEIINRDGVASVVDFHYKDSSGNNHYDCSLTKSDMSKSVKVPYGATDIYVRCIVNNSPDSLPDKKSVTFTDVMLNFGNRAYPWRPYDPSTAIIPKPEPVSNYIQRAMINLTAPLRSCGLINPVRDRIVRTGQKNAYKWKVHRRVGVQTLNGTENWEVSFVQGSYIRFALINNDLYDIAGPRMCDGLPYESVYDNTMTHECIHSSQEDGRIGVTILLSRLATSDVAGFKTWLSSNNLTVLYGKAQIEYEDLDSTSQTQLSAIEAYDSEHTTYMYTMDSVNPDLLVEYTGFGRYLFIAMLAADIEQLRNMDNSVKLVERFLTQFVPYYITPVVSGEVAQQEITGTHHMGVIVTESKIYTLVQYRSDNLTPQ